jgi:hypothetical protein
LITGFKDVEHELKAALPTCHPFSSHEDLDIPDNSTVSLYFANQAVAHTPGYHWPGKHGAACSAAEAATRLTAHIL